MRRQMANTEKRRSKFTFGMPYLIETKDIDQALDEVSRLGLEFIELNTNFPSSMVSRLNPDYLVDEAKKRRIFYSLHLDDAISIADFNPFVRKAYLDSSLEAIEFAKKVGIETINVHFSKGNIVTLPSGKNYLFFHYQEEFHENLIAFRDACEKAIGDEDIMIAIENTDGWEDYERQAIELLLESEVFGLTLDIGHNHAVSDKDLSFFMKHKNRLIHMHAHDGWDKTNHQALGRGEIDLKSRLDFAKSQQATVVLETKTLEALEESISWLKSNSYL
ncbi:MAG: sugar phosphate isomerase/epimerase family protein [Tissierellia bacterium]|nr:sugar phosphate isomerase/epimerase family protein [Tissierellia bacterium]